ncbi:MAG TPA: efflux RND transporter periplasmic adaptor subunit [Methylomirabilota bacterium]|nr:efflux RND transporter periplasmic adaptor subunit [Methylomirabilota bacterium]
MAEVVRKTVPIVSEFVAQTDAVQTVELRARIQGVLERVRFKEGSEVKEGQVLFEIERGQYEAALQSARAQLAKAQAELAQAKEQVEVLRSRAELEQRQAALAKARLDVARLRPLAQAKAVPQVDLDNALAAEQVTVAGVAAAEAALKDTELGQRIGIQQAQAAVEAGRAAVTQAQLDLSYTTIRAPVTGIVGRLDVNEGNLVGRGEPTLLATMSTYDPIKISATMSEVDYLRLARRAADRKAGKETPLELVLADGTRYPLTGQATTLDRTVDPKTGTIVIEALFPNPEKLLKPGQFGRVRAVVEERPDAVLVPQQAVQEVQGAKSVLVVGAEDKVVLRTVTLGERIDDLFIVTRGLEPGERVIVEGLQKVRPGMQVKPEAGAPSATAPGTPGSAPAPGPSAPRASPPAAAKPPSGG